MNFAVELRELKKRFQTDSYCWVCGLGLAFALGPALPGGGPLALVCGALTAVIAATWNLIFYPIMGLSAFFVADASPLFWMWQKLSFLLNYAPGRSAVGADPAFVCRNALTLAACLVLAWLAPHWARRRTPKALQPDGSCDNPRSASGEG